MEYDALAAGAGGAHVLHFGAALGELLHHDAGIVLIDVDDDFLDRLELLARRLIGAEHHARPPDGELEALAPHRLDQNAELQFAAPGHFESIGLVSRGRDAQGDIAFRLAQEALADDAALHLVAFLAGERPVIDAEGHGQGRRVDRLGGIGSLTAGSADRVGDGRVGQAGNGDDVAGLDLIDRLALEAAEGEHLGDAALLDDACRRAPAP